MWRLNPPLLEVFGMRKLIGGMVFAAIALSLPAAAMAQRRTMAASSAKHELGVDLGIAYAKPSGVSGGIEIKTPIDVRFGIVSGSKMMWEPRASLDFSSVGGNTTYLFVPGVNLLFANSPGMHRRGMYFTGGAALVLGDAGGGSGTAFQLNGGIGWRKPYESAAWRYEVGIRWTSESADLGLPSTMEIGGRIGISLWH